MFDVLDFPGQCITGGQYQWSDHFCDYQPNHLDGAAGTIVIKRVHVGIQGVLHDYFPDFLINSISILMGMETVLLQQQNFVTNTNYLIGMVYDGTLAIPSRVRVVREWNNG